MIRIVDASLEWTSWIVQLPQLLQWALSRASTVCRYRTRHSNASIALSPRLLRPIALKSECHAAVAIVTYLQGPQVGSSRCGRPSAVFDILSVDFERVQMVAAREKTP